MTAILETIGLFFGSVMTWVGDVVDLIAETPVLLIFVLGFTAIGFVVGVVKRLINVG